MQVRTHIAFGLLIFSTLSFLLNVPIRYSILAGFSAMLADIDLLIDKIRFRGSKLEKRYQYKLIRDKGVHRKLLHNVWSAILFSFLLYRISNYYSLLIFFSTFIGYMSHLILDSLTYMGIYWLWPYGDEKIFRKKRFYVSGGISTGSTLEKILYIIFISLSSIFFSLKINSFLNVPNSYSYENILILSMYSVLLIITTHILINLTSAIFSKIMILLILILIILGIVLFLGIPFPFRLSR